MEIVIRRARPDEMVLLCELDLAIFGEDDGFNSVDLWDGLATYLILADNKVVGSIAMRLHTDIAESYEADYLDRPGSIYIVSTGILPKWQGKGIGAIAKSFEIDYARKLNFERIVTNARASNIRSIKLNQKFGFQIIRTIAKWHGDEDAVVLELKL